MRVSVITLFPEYFTGPLSVSIVGRAVESGSLDVELVQLRDFGKGVHRQVDDAPFGGGAGMVLMPDPLARALEPLSATHRVLMTPAGRRMDQAAFDRWSTIEHLTLVCGRYEGVDQRVVDHLIDEEASLGDFVLAGGEAAAAAAIEGVSRLLPGVLGNPESPENESFRDGLLEEPQYTRPASYRGWDVPEILLSGDHGRIETWRREQRIERTRQRRPDLYEAWRAAGGDAPGDS
jgi:tRNA (guanine37-N1)-methyltransferase